MKSIVCKKEPQRHRLQDQENNNGKKAADEDKYITQLGKFEVRCQKSDVRSKS